MDELGRTGTVAADVLRATSDEVAEAGITAVALVQHRLKVDLDDRIRDLDVVVIELERSLAQKVDAARLPAQTDRVRLSDFLVQIRIAAAETAHPLVILRVPRALTVGERQRGG